MNGHELILGIGQQGVCHYLDGRPVHLGARLWLQLNSQWQPVQFDPIRATRGYLVKTGEGRTYTDRDVPKGKVWRWPVSGSGEDLIRGTDHFGRRYFLYGRPVYNGSIVEVLVHGDWQRVRLEGLPQWPHYYALKGPDTLHPVSPIPQGPIYRWPA